MTTEVNELPEERDIVIATVKNVSSHGAYVTLDEYGGMTGFLHISEIATGWIRHIERFVKPKQKVILKVKRVNRARSEIDLSLKHVGGEEKKEKLLEVKKEEKGRAFMEIIKEKCKLSDDQVTKYYEVLTESTPLLYDVFGSIAKKGVKVIEDLDLPTEVVAAIEEIANKIPIPTVEVRGVLEITCRKSNGIEIIKEVLKSVEDKKSGVKVTISYIGAPKYRIMVNADNFKIAEKVLNTALQKIEDGIQKKNASFKFTREESKKRRQA
ncbi:MAG: RNA-binding protein [Thaumarchaeota archaeon]|nr:RNA-binding protein [Nitrososphaerota archaeon]